MSLELLELALNMGYELARLNRTQEMYPEFWRFTLQHYENFPGEYSLNSHARRNTTGNLEKSLVTYLIKMCCYKCSLQNCQLASQILTFLGYDSYRIMTHRFRQKVENYLRKERKEGGLVPPSTRSFPYYSMQSSNNPVRPTVPFTRSAARNLKNSGGGMNVFKPSNAEKNDSSLMQNLMKKENEVDSDVSLNSQSSSFDSSAASSVNSSDFSITDLRACSIVQCCLNDCIEN